MRGWTDAAWRVRRLRILPRLIPVTAPDLAGDAPAARRHVLRLLGRALRSERVRGQAGHWTYDLARHRALAAANAAERRLAGGPVA